MQLTAGGLLQGDKYLLNHPLETQGFGITYRATQQESGRAVVVKTLHPALHSSKAFNRLRDRFVDIGSLMTRSQHGSLVKVLDLFQEQQLPFVVMEYVAGSSLAELVSPERPMAEMEALHYIRLAGEAIASGHRANLIHGNLKPQNILRRTGTSTPVVLGYGISADRMLAAVQYAVPGFPHGFTAPEQIGEQGNRLPVSDLYGLAANLYFLLTGYEPPSAIDRLQQDNLPHADRLSPTMQRILQQGMALAPRHRSPSLEQWLDLLPSASQPRAKAAPRVTAPPEAIAATEIPLPVSPTATPTAPTVIEPPEGVTLPPSRRPQPEPPRYRQEPLPDTAYKTPPPAPAPPKPSTAAPPPYRQEPIAVQMELELDTVPIHAATGYPSTNEVHPPLPQAQNKLLDFPPRIRRMLLLTSCIAALIGGSFGLALRFSAARNPQGGSLFHADQTFPDREWTGTLTPTDNGDSPIEAPSVMRGNPGEKDDQPTSKTPPAFNDEPIIDSPTSRPASEPIEAAPIPEAPSRRRDRLEADPASPAAPVEKTPRSVEPPAPQEVAPEPPAAAPEPAAAAPEPAAAAPEPEAPAKTPPKTPTKTQ